MLQNLFYTWFGSTFLFKIWRIYGKCQKQSPTVTFRHQCCKQIASIVFVFCLCVCFCLCFYLCQLSERSHVSTIALQLKKREGPNDVHLNQDEEVWAVAPSVRRAGGRRQEAAPTRWGFISGSSTPFW